MKVKQNPMTDTITIPDQYFLHKSSRETMTPKEMVESGTKLKDGSAAHTRLPFVHRLYLMLQEVEAQGNDHIISWIGDGKAFRIHDPLLFESSIQPKYFHQT